ncbi:hypothetical protein EYZ11_005193 [Aspergillus tanneri]|uniref:Uncharacterized protein n=1 Tax=Aspergillus tanneri TaxID=1220188 RepID=A0A4S3JIR5_9EURO|nr:hypothetical protein EYZ11_005193 [Aspergillus tanneri]
MTKDSNAHGTVTLSEPGWGRRDERSSLASRTPNGVTGALPLYATGMGSNLGLRQERLC